MTRLYLVPRREQPTAKKWPPLVVFCALATVVGVPWWVGIYVMVRAFLIAIGVHK